MNLCSNHVLIFVNMAGMEFVIPAGKEELRRDEGKGVYVVRQTFDSDELTVVLEECATTFDSDGPRAIVDCFDAYYSFICCYLELGEPIRCLGWNSSVTALEELSLEIARWLDDPVMENKMIMRSSIKMCMFVVIQLMEIINNEETKPSLNVVAKGNKSRKKSVATGKFDWPFERERAMRVITQLLGLDLKQLWEPPLPSSLDDLSNMMVGCCFKLLEDPSAARDKSLRELLVQVLGHLVYSYNQMLGVVLKAVQMLQHFEHLVSPLAQIIQSISQQFQSTNIVTEIIRELANRDPVDLSMDTSGTRCFCAFITELGQRTVAAMLPIMESLLVHLGGESYVMRNAVLSVMGELLVQELSESTDDAMKKTRDHYLDMLEEHLHDTNAFVRSKVLQIWRQLCEAKVIPINRQHQLLETVRGRLRDRSSVVRKSAIVLLTSFLTSNPYAARLDEDQLTEQLTTAQEQLKQLQNHIPSEEEFTDIAPDEHLTQQMAQQMLTVRYLTDTVEFTSSMCSCVPVITQLLGSKNSSDVIESLQFLTSAYEFNLKGATEAVRKALALVWSPEQQICEALMLMYKKLFLSGDGKEGLLSLVEQPSVSDYTSLQQLILLLSKAGHIIPSLLNQLWDVFAMKEGAKSSERRSGQALLVLAMASDQDMIHSHLSLLVSVGLGSRAQRDPLLAVFTCYALQQLMKTQRKEQQTTKDDKQLSDKKFRLSASHVIFTRLTELLVSGLPDLSLTHWQTLAEQSIITIYGLAEQPDILCEQLLLQLLTASGLDDSFNPIATSSQDHEGAGLEEMEHSLVLARLLGCVGCVAQRQLVHLEVTVIKELKKQRHEEQEKKTPRKRAANHKKEQSTVTEEELMLTGATADDPEVELIKRLCETELLEETNMFGKFVPIILDVCHNPSHYFCPTLQTAATLSLAKLMLISSRFCEQQLQLLVTILEKSSMSVIRANTIVCLADLMVRFPNLVEPWTAHLYNRLRDESEMVRKSTLVSLTHLILNDMIKVKGQISEIALCMEDTDNHIADFSRLFFHELAKKGNSLYNLLPDAIGKLSEPDNSVTTSSFQTIMKYLLSFIQKDRQAESLVEKLCHRFRTTRFEKQWADLSFCLAQLPYSERCLHKLQQNMNCYQDKLYNDEVYHNLIIISTRTKKFAKPEVKLLLEELEEQWKKFHDKGTAEQSSPAPSRNVTQEIKGSTVKKSVSKRRGGRRQQLREINNNDDHSIMEDLSPAKKQNTPVHRNTIMKSH